MRNLSSFTFSIIVYVLFCLSGCGWGETPTVKEGRTRDSRSRLDAKGGTVEPRVAERATTPEARRAKRRQSRRDAADDRPLVVENEAGLSEDSEEDPNDNVTPDEAIDSEES